MLISCFEQHRVGCKLTYTDQYPTSKTVILLIEGQDRRYFHVFGSNKAFTIGDLSLRATFAIPTGGDDLTHVGYLVSVQDGPKVYLTGDTGYHDVLATSVAEHRPDVVIANRVDGAQ